MADEVSRGSAAADHLEAAAASLLGEVAVLPPELVTWEPAKDVWSVMDILCHVQEFVPYWMGQAQGVIRHPGSEWGRNHADKDRLAAVTGTSARKLTDVEQAIRARVADAARALRSLTDADLSAEGPSRNPRWGTQPAGFIIEHLLVEHVEKHIGQVRRNVAQYRQEAERAR